MHLLIRAVSLAGQPLTQAISAYFDERGGTIGRSDTNTLALPDPERRISRLQAEVSRSSDGWRILNVGNANPIWHNNKPVSPGETVLLDENDELQVGTYALQVTYSQNDATARTITKGRAAVDSRTVIVGSGQEPRTDPSMMRMVPQQADAASPASAAPVAAHAPVPPPAPTATPVAPMPVAGAAPAPAGASPFADLLGEMGAPAAASHAASAASPFADLFGSPSPSPSAFPSSGQAPSASSPFSWAAASTPAPASTPAAVPAPTVASRLPDDFDPFADLAPAPPSSHSSSGRSAGVPAAWDLPSSPAPRPSASPFDLGAGASPLPGDLDLGNVVAPAGGQSIDQLFGLGRAPAADPLADFLKKTEPAAPAEAPAGAPSAIDPLALLTPRSPASTGASPAFEPAGGPALSDDVPALQGAMPLPPVMPAAVGSVDEAPTVTEGLFKTSPKPAPDVLADDFPDVSSVAALDSPSRASQAAAPQGVAVPVSSLSPVSAQPSAPPVAPPLPASPADVHALWTAFCEGAGIQFTPPQGLNPELMRVIGQLLRHAVDGSLKLVAARAATKQEMRAEVTVIQARRNNPLKFSPDTQSAMEQLLQPPLRGFMSGPEAVSDAMDDLLGHTIGTMVGMRAALEGVLARFEPEQLEAKLVGRSMLDSLLPMNRRAKLWELYLQHYGSVRTEAQDDFHNLFGRAFLQAYEEQLDRLHAERHPSSPAASKPA